MNRKFTCQIKYDFNEVEENDAQSEHKIAQNEHKIAQKTDIYSCHYCGEVFSLKNSVTRHIKKFCKVKKLQDEEKENIFKMLLLKDEQLKNKDDEVKTYKDELKNYKEHIEKLTKMNLDLNEKINKLVDKVSAQNINIGIINNINNNIIISSDKLSKFGDENLNLIDFKYFQNVNKKIGKDIIVECAKNIYNNPDVPQNKTMYISDISRDKCMAWTGENWDLMNMNKAMLIVDDQIKKYFDYNIGKSEKLKDPKIKRDFDIRITKYIKLYYDEFGEDEKEPPKERVEQFQQSVNEDLIKFFYNIRDDIKNNFIKIQEKFAKTIEDNKYDNNSIVKRKGRPKKI